MAICKLVGGAEDTIGDDNAVGILVPEPILNTLVDICGKVGRMQGVHCTPTVTLTRD